jgi:hypothetical protein
VGRNQWHLHAMLASTLVLGACGGGGESASSSQPATIAPRPVEQSDLQIASALYSGTTRVPVDFYAEKAAGAQSTVATTHIKNTDVDRTIASTAPEFELCTDDWSQALSWSETSALNAPQYSNLVATNDDVRFFEFGRVKPGSPEVYVQSRVYKCAYLNRSAANLRAPSTCVR